MVVPTGLVVGGLSRHHMFISVGDSSFVLLILQSLCFLQSKVFFKELLEQFWRDVCKFVILSSAWKSTWRFLISLYWLGSFKFFLGFFLRESVKTRLFQRSSSAWFAKINFWLFLLWFLDSCRSDYIFPGGLFKSFL